MIDLQFTEILFFIFSGLLITSALMVILQRNTVKSALFLILTFVAAAGLWMLLHAEFLAVVLVLVYVGAVMVLFLFVVMMLDIDFKLNRSHFNRYIPLALMVAIGFLLALNYVVDNADIAIVKKSAQPNQLSNVEQLGLLIYTDYFYPFELAAVLLLIAMVAAISITFRGKRQRKSQQVDKQVNASKHDRVKLVDIERPSSEKSS